MEAAALTPYSEADLVLCLKLGLSRVSMMRSYKKYFLLGAYKYVEIYLMAVLCESL